MDREQTAVERLKAASEISFAVYGLPLVITTSGGKDSSVCMTLAEHVGIPFKVMHSDTTADALETIYFVWEEFKRLETAGIKCTITYPLYGGNVICISGTSFLEANMIIKNIGQKN